MCLRESLLACVLLNNFARKPVKRTGREGERLRERGVIGRDRERQVVRRKGSVVLNKTCLV